MLVPVKKKNINQPANQKPTKDNLSKIHEARWLFILFI